MATTTVRIIQQSNVIAIAGLGTSHSYGFKEMLRRLSPWVGEHRQIDYTEFMPYEHWKAEADSMVGWKDNTIFWCHSYGVAAAFGIIRRWGNRGPKVPLVICYDPSQFVWMDPKLWGSGGNTCPDRVIKYHNFWQQGWPIGYQRVYRPDGSERDGVNEEVDSTHVGIEDLPYTQQKGLDLTKAAVGIGV